MQSQSAQFYEFFPVNREGKHNLGNRFIFLKENASVFHVFNPGSSHYFTVNTQQHKTKALMSTALFIEKSERKKM